MWGSASIKAARNPPRHSQVALLLQRDQPASPLFRPVQVGLLFLLLLGCLDATDGQVTRRRRAPTGWTPKGCQLKDMPTAPVMNGVEATTNCAGEFSNELAVTNSPAQGGLSTLKLSSGMTVLCYSYANTGRCYSVLNDMRHMPNVITLASSPVTFNAGPVSNIGMALLATTPDAYKIIICYADGAASSRGNCMVLIVAFLGTMETTPLTTNQFTGIGVAASNVVLTRLSENSIIFCYAVASEAKGLCQSIQYQNDASQLAFATNGQLQISSTGPASIAISTFTSSQALLCWMDSLQGLCKVLILTDTALSAPGASVLISSTAMTYITTDVFSDSSAIICYNTGGKTGLCNSLTLDSTYSLSVGPSVVTIETQAAAYLSTAVSDSETATTCYKSSDVTGGNIKCAVFNKDGKYLTTSVKSVFDIPGSATYVNIIAMTNTTLMLCYQKEVNDYLACVTMEILDDSSETCYRNIPGYSCDHLYCATGPGYGDWNSLIPNPSCYKSCSIGDITAAPTSTDIYDGSVVTAGATCDGFAGTQSYVSTQASAGYTTVAVLGTSTLAIVCYTTDAESYCVQVDRTTTQPNVLTKQQPVLLHLAKTTYLVSGALDSSTAIACYADGAQGDRGVCNMMQHVGGELEVSFNAFGFFTIQGDPAAHMAVTKFSSSISVVCYSVHSSIVSAAFCQSIVYTGAAHALTFPANGKLQFASTDSPVIAVTTISSTQVLVCWMDITQGKCVIMTLTGTALSMGSQLTITTGMSLSSISISIQDGTAVVCYASTGTSRPYCVALTIGGDTLSMGGQPLEVAQNSVNAVTVACTHPKNCVLCYEDTVLATTVCKALTVTTSGSVTYLVSNFKSTVPAAGAASYSTILPIDQDAMLLCYEVGSNSFPACSVVNSALRSGSKCLYHIDGHTCTEQACNNGKWGDSSTCVPGCLLQNYPVVPTALPRDGSVRAATFCDGQSGDELQLGVSSDPGAVAMTTLNRLEGIVCYSTDGYTFAGYCIGVSLNAGTTTITTSGPTGSNTPSLLSDGFTSGIVMDAMNGASAIVCYIDGSANNIGKCTSLSFAGKGSSVLVSTHSATFSGIGDGISFITLAAFAGGQAGIICYSVIETTTGQCRVFQYRGETMPINFPPATTTSPGEPVGVVVITTMIAPTTMSVSALSSNKAIVCWTDPQGTQCKVLISDNAGNSVSAPGPSLFINTDVETNNITITTLRESGADATTAVICYVVKEVSYCVSMRFDGTYTLTISGAAQNIHTVTPSALFAASPSSTSALVCYQSVAGGLVMDVSCSLLKQGNDGIESNPIASLMPKIGAASSIISKYFAGDKTSVLICYRKTNNGMVSCSVVQTTIGSGKDCNYELLEYQCESTGCSKGKWGAASTCITKELAQAQVAEVGGVPVIWLLLLFLVVLLVFLVALYSQLKYPALTLEQQKAKDELEEEAVMLEMEEDEEDEEEFDLEELSDLDDDENSLDDEGLKQNSTYKGGRSRSSSRTKNENHVSVI